MVSSEVLPAVGDRTLAAALIANPLCRRSMTDQEHVRRVRGNSRSDRSDAVVARANRAVLRRFVVALLRVVLAGVSTEAGRVLVNADHVHELDMARMHRVRPPPLAISTRSAE